MNIIAMIGSALLLIIYSLLRKNSSLKTDVDVLKSNPHAQADADTVADADADVAAKERAYEDSKRNSD